MTQRHHKMRQYQIIIGALLLTILTSCSSTSTLSDEYADFDLSAYQSFDFLTIEGPDEKLADYEANLKFLKEEINRQMTERGLKQDASSPDIKINLGIVVENRVQTRTTNLATDPFMYSGQRNYTWESREVPVNTYKEGTLTMHLVEGISNKVVWAGTASRVVPKKTDKKQRAAQEAVSELFDQIDN